MHIYIQSWLWPTCSLMKIIIIHCNGSWKQCLHTVFAFEYMVFDEIDHYSVQWKLESCIYIQSWLWPICCSMKMIIIHCNGSWNHAYIQSWLWPTCCLMKMIIIQCNGLYVVTWPLNNRQLYFYTGQVVKILDSPVKS